MTLSLKTQESVNRFDPGILKVVSGFRWLSKIWSPFESLL